MGQRFGKLTVLEYAGKHSGMHRWKCLCDCGNETIVGQTLLQTGKTKSCGCLQAKVYIQNLKLCEGTSIPHIRTIPIVRIVSRVTVASRASRRLDAIFSRLSLSQNLPEMLVWATSPNPFHADFSSAATHRSGALCAISDSRYVAHIGD